MIESSNANLERLSEIVAKQKALGRRLLWLLVLPFVITAAMVPMFFALSARVVDVEVATKIVTIERYLLVDKNDSWAIDQYEQIAKIQASAPILTRLGTLYFRRNPKDEEIAIQKLTAAKDVNPTYWEIYRSLTYIHLVMGRSKEAIEAGVRALQLNENDANTYNNLAWLYATSNEPSFRDLARAQEYGDKAVKLTNERQAHFLDTLAEVYFQKGGEGDRDRALRYFRKAVEVCDRADLRAFRERLKSRFPNENL